MIKREYVVITSPCRYLRFKFVFSTPEQRQWPSVMSECHWCILGSIYFWEAVCLRGPLQSAPCLCWMCSADALLSSSSSLFLSFNNCFLENKVLSANRLLWIKPLWKVFPNLRTSMHVMRCYWKVYIIIKQYSEYGEKCPCVLFYSAGDDFSTSTYEVVCLVQPFLI